MRKLVFLGALASFISFQAIASNNFSIGTIILTETFSDSSVSSVDSVQKDTIWKTGGLATFTLSQSAFVNWAAGGEDAFSGNSRLSLFANYNEKKASLDNSLDIAYGLTKQNGEKTRKNDDSFEFTTKFGYKASKKWNYSSIFNLKSQFSKGYNYKENDSIAISKFFSPAYINLAIGMDFKPSKQLSVFISPLTAKMTVVADTSFSERYSIDKGKTYKSVPGFILKARYQKVFYEKVSVLAKLDVFTNYKNKPFTPQHLDYNLEVLASVKVLKVLSVNLNTQILYDDDVKFEREGKEPTTKVQFKEVFGIGLAYKF